MGDAHKDGLLATNARIEISIQVSRIIKSFTSTKRMDDAAIFLEYLKAGKLATWEANIEGIRGKRLFKSRIAILRSLTGGMRLDMILSDQEIANIEAIIYRV